MHRLLLAHEYRYVGDGEYCDVAEKLTLPQKFNLYSNYNSVHLKQQIISALDNKNPELKKIMLNVRKQVSRYEAAKKAGTLKKTDSATARLF